MQDFAHWLEELGMSEYVQRFAANDIDIEVLGDRPTRTLIALAFQSGIAGSSLKALAEGVETGARSASWQVRY